MKIKLNEKVIKQLTNSDDKKVTIADPWWVILIKVIVYAAGLLLAGYGTTAAASTMLGANLMMGLF